MTPTHYVHYNGSSVFVKEASFFFSQGGLREPWGDKWVPVWAATIGEARRIGAGMFGVTLSHLFEDEE